MSLNMEYIQIIQLPVLRSPRASSKKDGNEMNFTLVAQDFLKLFVVQHGSSFTITVAVATERTSPPIGPINFHFHAVLGRNLAK